MPPGLLNRSHRTTESGRSQGPTERSILIHGSLVQKTRIDTDEGIISREFHPKCLPSMSSALRPLRFGRE